MEISKIIIFDRWGELKIERPDKFGGDIVFKSYLELEGAFTAKELHPMDLKTAVGSYINKLMKPVTKYFDSHPENLEQVTELMKLKNR